MELDNMSDEKREAMIALSMLTVGNARSCFTEDELLGAEESLQLAKTRTTEWNPSTNISLAHPKIGVCAAAAVRRICKWQQKHSPR